jgi:hypothetical protein
MPRQGKVKKNSALGMREMQERVYAARDAQYLLLNWAKSRSHHPKCFLAN